MLSKRLNFIIRRNFITRMNNKNSKLIANQRLLNLKDTLQMTNQQQYSSVSKPNNDGITLSHVAEPKQAEVLHRKQATGRTFILNRPNAFNALNLNMIRNMYPQLQAWDQSDLCKVIQLKTNHPKAFCSGGDIKALANSAKNQDETGSTFFAEEYRLNHLIATLKTPFVALMDGITMGGGVGLSVHAPFRVATEKTLFAMPETSIGLFPDVGGTFFLSRMQGQLGVYLGLTGTRLKGRDVFWAGIATHYVPSERLPLLEERLNELDSDEIEVVNQAIEDFVAEMEPDYQFSLEPYLDAIDRCFKYESVKDIIKALKEEKEHPEWAKKTIETLEASSPTSLIVTREQIRQGATLDIAQSFNLEYHLGKKFLAGHDFPEGVEAKLIRKPPTNPSWSPATLEECNESEILDHYFSNVDLTALPLTNHKQTTTTYLQYPYKTGLPTQDEIIHFLKEGNTMRPTVEEVLLHFNLVKDNKVGTKEFVLNVLKRVCDIDPSTGELVLKH